MDSANEDRSTARVRFDAFELDLATGELWLDRTAVSLRPTAARALCALVRRAGSVVSKEELRRELWGDAIVEWDASIYQAIRQVRRALGEDRSAPRWIETVPRVGYRFIGRIDRLTPARALPAAARSEPHPSGPQRWFRGPRDVGLFVGGGAFAAGLLVLWVIVCALAA